MAKNVASPPSPNHDNRRACPQSGHHLHEFIKKGQAEFSSVVEIIRILGLDKKQQGKGHQEEKKQEKMKKQNKEQQEKQQQGQQLQEQRLITDFIKFRHLTAHKRLSDLGYLQMVGAFVLYCRKLVLPKDRRSQATTKVLAKEFPRMADINLVVCATWYFYINNLAAVRSHNRQMLVKNLNNYANDSSFSDYHFAVSGDNIIVKHNGKPKPFDGDLLNELAEVLKTPVEYTQDEIAEFKQLYKYADNIAEAESGALAVQGVLRKLEIGCTCQKDDLAKLTEVEVDEFEQLYERAANTYVAGNALVGVGLQGALPKFNIGSINHTDDLADELQHMHVAQK